MKINLNEFRHHTAFGNDKFLKTTIDKKTSTATITVKDHLKAKDRIQRFISNMFGTELRKISKVLNSSDGQKILSDQNSTEISAQNIKKLNDKIEKINKRLLFRKIPKIHVPEVIAELHPILDDPNISNNVKDLFKLLFIDTIHPANIKEVQPLGNLLKSIEVKLQQFNQTHDTKLGCYKSAHSYLLDPWQTIKITEPSIAIVGEMSPVLEELNQVLFEKFGIQSNGGDDCIVNKGQKKMPAQCFINKEGEKMYPQLLITLIDIKRIIGIIPDKEAYIQTLRDAYSPSKRITNPYLNN